VYLSDRDILAEMKTSPLISPFTEEQLQPASYDVTLDNEFVYWTGSEWKHLFCDEGEGFELQPNEFALGSTVETITVPIEMMAQVSGKSTWARRGLTVHQTAGFVDPGFSGTITLEFKNVGPEILLLEPGKAIAQVSWCFLWSECLRPYGPERGSHYQGQVGVKEAWNR